MLKYWNYVIFNLSIRLHSKFKKKTKYYNNKNSKMEFNIEDHQQTVYQKMRDLQQEL